MKFDFLKKLKPTKKKEDDSVEIVAYKHVGRLRMLTILIATFSILILGYTIWFAYIRINNTIGNAEEFIFLQAELGIEPVDFMSLQEVTNRWNEIRSTSTPEITRNPFVGAVVAEAPAPENENIDEVVPSL